MTFMFNLGTASEALHAAVARTLLHNDVVLGWRACASDPDDPDAVAAYVYYERPDTEEPNRLSVLWSELRERGHR